MMNLEEQIKVIFFAFSYGIISYFIYNVYKLKKIKGKIIKYLFEFLLCFINVCIFYFLLYKINGGILNIYVLIFLILGEFFCKVLIFNDKKY